MQYNMLVPGQVEKWVNLTNINQFPIKNIPITIFKQCARELTCNYIDQSKKNVIVNLTWFQEAVARFLQSFLDPEVVRR